MSRRRIYIIIIAVLVIVAAYFVVAAAFPKELSRYPVFVLILLLDLYLWNALRSTLEKWKKPVRVIFNSIYWLPLLLVISMGISSLFINLYLWQPHLATYSGGIVFIIYASKLFAIVFFLLADLIKIIRHAIRFAWHKKKMTACPEAGKRISRGKFLQNMGLIGGGFVLSGLIIGAIRWAYDFRVKREYLRFPDLPPQLDGLKIVQISDLHLGSWANISALQDAVDVINQEDADFIFFTGDLVNFLTKEAYRFKHILSQLEAKFGVFAVLGNHDYGDYVKWDSAEAKEENLRELEYFYKEIGWHLLRNNSVLAKINDVTIAIAGVENWSAYDRFPRYGDLKKALEGTEKASFKVLLSHDPTHWDRIVSRKHPDIDITLSGHTHGFQFGVELKNFKWSPAQYMYKRWAGLYDNPAGNKPQYLYVNRGLGMIGYPGRIGILPEITVLELTSGFSVLSA
ncbi:MAG: metallophosphoesterase [Bacteroidales bacterium]|nr:metallophosphoesterase [Bacteroidales bacterium]